MINRLATIARWSRALMFWIVPIPIAAHWVMAQPPEPAWRAQYYDNAELRGTPKLIAREARIDARWGKGSPDALIPADNFSVRWDTCMRIDRASNVALQITSEGRARLYVDHKLTVDEWKPHRIRSVGGSVPLTAGWHHVRVQYANETGSARIALAASFGDEVPQALASDRLAIPGHDSQAPCRGAK